MLSRKYHIQKQQWGAYLTKKRKMAHKKRIQKWKNKNQIQNEKTMEKEIQNDKMMKNKIQKWKNVKIKEKSVIQQKI